MYFPSLWKHFLILLSVLSVSVDGSDGTFDLSVFGCKTLHGKVGECVPLRSCPSLQSVFNGEDHVVKLLQESICSYVILNETVVCCEVSDINQSSKEIRETTLTSQHADNSFYNLNLTEQLYRDYVKLGVLINTTYCGLQHTDDRLSENADSTALDEFPWLVAILSEKEPEAFRKKYDGYCTGALITRKFVLTNMYCAVIATKVRLGLYHAQQNISCYYNKDVADDECSDPVVDVNVTLVPSYNDASIGLLKLDTKVQFTEFIRPICLPLQQSVMPTLNEIIITSGWGTTKDRGSPKKRLLFMLRDGPECDIPNFRYTITASHFNYSLYCAISQQHTTDSECEQDSGTPFMFARRNRWYIVAIKSLRMSFNARHMCSGSEAPVFGSAIDENALKWILHNLKVHS